MSRKQYIRRIINPPTVEIGNSFTEKEYEKHTMSRHVNTDSTIFKMTKGIIDLYRECNPNLVTDIWLGSQHQVHLMVIILEIMNIMILFYI